MRISGTEPSSVILSQTCSINIKSWKVPYHLLRNWGLTEEAKCHLCQEVGTLEHILSSCKVALQQGRYRWRHEQVLRTVAHTLEIERKNDRKQQSSGRFISFVRGGEQPKTTSDRRETAGIFGGANDWTLMVDLEKKLVFPRVVETRLRPDMLLQSSSSQKLVMVELTVPWETRTQEAYERKAAKYADPVEQCREQGYRAWCFPIEVGARGLPSKSCWKMLGALGVQGRVRKQAINNMAQAAERASCWLWMRRNESSWKPDHWGQETDHLLLTHHLEDVPS